MAWTWLLAVPLALTALGAASATALFAVLGWYSTGKPDRRFRRCLREASGGLHEDEARTSTYVLRIVCNVLEEVLQWIRPSTQSPWRILVVFFLISALFNALYSGIAVEVYGKLLGKLCT